MYRPFSNNDLNWCAGAKKHALSLHYVNHKKSDQQLKYSIMAITCRSKLLLPISLLFPAITFSETPLNNYKLRCMICHGKYNQYKSEGMLRLSGFVGHFLKIEGGREYLVQVPNVAYSPLSDKEVGKLLNFVIDEFSGISK